MAQSPERHREWVRDWQDRRRAAGRCRMCPTGRLTINPRTGHYFHRCRDCRLRFNEYFAQRAERRVAA